MSDATAEAPVPGAGGPKSAGTLLREARQAQGMHIAALAAAIKVAPRKLEALEGDRYDELVDATFTRALAMTVCRALKIDPEPILERLPQTAARGLDQVSAGLNAPFRERGVRREGADWRAANRPAVWGAVVLLAAAALVLLLPSHWIPSHFFGEAASAPEGGVPASGAAAQPHVVREPVTPVVLAPSAPVAAAASTVPASAGVTPGLPASSPAPSASTASVALAASAAAPKNGLLRIETTTGASWVEVHDAAGKTLIARLLPAGESVALDGTPPLSVKIGHAAVTRMSFRGQPVPLSPHDTVVRMELK